MAQMESQRFTPTSQLPYLGFESPVEIALQSLLSQMAGILDIQKKSSNEGGMGAT
jgi:hypothetical protein